MLQSGLLLALGTVIGIYTLLVLIVLVLKVLNRLLPGTIFLLLRRICDFIVLSLDVHLGVG